MRNAELTRRPCDSTTGRLCMTQQLYHSTTLCESTTTKGFTLIEIVVGLAILGIGLTVILELFSGGLKSARISEEYTKATWYGKTKMEEMLMTKELSEGASEGAFNDEFSWKSEVKKMVLPLGQDENAETSLPVDLYRITVTVTWSSGAGKRSLELESLRTYKNEEGISGKVSSSVYQRAYEMPV
jgi:general secretion pathway protein I